MAVQWQCHRIDMALPWRSAMAVPLGEGGARCIPAMLALAPLGWVGEGKMHNGTAGVGAICIPATRGWSTGVFW